MRLWPLLRGGWPRKLAGSADADAFLIQQDLLRRNVEDVFHVRQAGGRGHAFLFAGDLLEKPARALALIEPRFRAHGYTPFLSREGNMTWLHAVPLVETTARSRPALNIVLFLLTLLSTVAVGAFWAGAVPYVTFDPLKDPMQLLAGLPFAATLLAILGTHEFGHYFAARAYGVSVSLPFFIPAPPPFPFGTLGAVIRMRSPVRDRNALLDIAAAGPIAGMLVAVPAVWLGLAWSRVGTIPSSGAMSFGDSLLMRLMTWAMFGRIPDGMDVFIHPVALAGWVGFLVTALNLFPVGQLDGGRIAYALFGAHHRKVSVATFVGLIALGVLSGSPNWYVFAGIVVLLVGFHHMPPLDDVTPLTPGRYAVGLACLVMLVLLVPPVPIAFT